MITVAEYDAYYQRALEILRLDTKDQSTIAPGPVHSLAHNLIVQDASRNALANIAQIAACIGKQEK